MNKFKIGDKVVRFQRSESARDGGLTKEGLECEVSFMSQTGNVIMVVGSPYIYSAKNFKLVEEPPTFKAMKFRVNSPEQSKEIQEALFSMGYRWELYGKQLKSFKDFTGNTWLEKWLHTDEDGILYRSDEDPDYDVTPSSPFYHQEYTIKTTKSYELIPVEIPTQVPTIVSGGTIELNGEVYTQEEVASAVQFLKFVRNKERFSG